MAPAASRRTTARPRPARLTRPTLLGGRPGPPAECRTGQKSPAGRRRLVVWIDLAGLM